MADSLISAFSDSLDLGSDWEISRVITDRETRRMDLYVSHVGRQLVCPETGSWESYMTTGRNGYGVT